MIPVGIMQGRLSAPRDGQIQSFPTDSWESEFESARLAGLSCIEWLHDAESAPHNPLVTARGRARIRQCVDDSGVGVHAVTADSVKTEPLVSADGEPHPESCRLLADLLRHAADLGCAHVMVPFVDEASLLAGERLRGAPEVLAAALDVAAGAGIEIHLESDLPANRWIELLDTIGSSSLRVCFDLGDRAACGFDSRGDLEALAEWIGSVHIKDRPVGGATLPLGEGAADIAGALEFLGRSDFSAPLVLQTARGDTGSELELARRNLSTLKREWERGERE